MVSDSLTDAGYRRADIIDATDSPMLIVCPNCATSYEVEASSLSAAGRSVRCVRCRHVWFARDPAALAMIAQAHRDDVEALTSTLSVAPLGDGPRAEPPEAADLVIAGGQAAADAVPHAEVVENRRARDGDWPGRLPASPEPIPVTDAPALAPMEQGAALPVDAAAGEDIESFARRRASQRARRQFSWPMVGLPLAILALIALNAALIGWRADVVRAAPQTASLYAALGLPVNLRGLTFANVTTATEMHDGVQVLVVEGEIQSASPRIVEVPRLRISVRNRAGQEVYAWTALPGRSVLAPGENLPFRSRLASPPPDLRDVLVRFFNRRDLIAGIQ